VRDSDALIAALLVLSGDTGQQPLRTEALNALIVWMHDAAKGAQSQERYGIRYPHTRCAVDFARAVLRK
jgi:hypothetical protein